MAFLIPHNGVGSLTPNSLRMLRYGSGMDDAASGRALADAVARDVLRQTDTDMDADEAEKRIRYIIHWHFYLTQLTHTNTHISQPAKHAPFAKQSGALYNQLWLGLWMSSDGECNRKL